MDGLTSEQNERAHKKLRMMMERGAEPVSKETIQFVVYIPSTSALGGEMELATFG